MLLRHPALRRTLRRATVAPADAEPIFHDITVRADIHGYRTSRVRGISAASTSSPARAAERLAEKLFGVANIGSVRRLDTARASEVSYWRIDNRAALAAGG